MGLGHRLRNWLVKDVGATNQVERDQWIEKQLKSLPAGLRILDAGAGERPYQKHCKHLTYVAQDFAQYDGSGNNQGFQMGSWNQQGLDLVCDITAIPEKDGAFDVILCSEVLEHVPDPAKALKELARLLRSGGKLIVTAPFCSLTHFAPFHFATGFNRYFYEKVLSDFNMTLREVTASGNYFEFMAQEINRLPYMSEQYAQKKMNVFQRFLLDLVKYILRKLSANDKGSSEILAYGYFVIAEKN